MATTLLLICGSLRAGSVNAAILDTVAVVAPADFVIRRFRALDRLPHFNPDNDRDPLDSNVADLRREIGSADAVLFCTPEYAGALPGSFKNLLDWTVGGTELNAKPVGWINSSSISAPAGGADAHMSLRRVLGYVTAHIVEDACVRIPVARNDIGPDGIIQTGEIRKAIGATLEALERGTRRRSTS